MSDLKPPPSLTPEALAVWQSRAPALLAARTISEVDVDTLASWCECTALSRIAAARLSKDGVLDGDGKRSPAAGVYFSAVAEARRLSVELGMTPASRARVATADPAPAPSDWDKI